MKIILIPTDFSENAFNAIEYAINFFKEENCNFHLLHVQPIVSTTNEVSSLLDQNTIEAVYIKPVKEKLKQLLERVRNLNIKQKNHTFSTSAEFSFFIDAIKKHVVEKEVDYIVMGTKGASGLKEVLIGSNTGDVIKKVACTTLVVPENARFMPVREIAFPTDFSLSYYIETLLPLSKVVASTSASLRILHINKSNNTLNKNQIDNKDLLEDIFVEDNFSFHTLTNQKIENAIQCFVENRNIDMIAMVAKNLNYFQQILFHSRVEKISYHTNVPFLVLHDTK